VTGRGDALANLGDRRPLVRDSDVFAIGMRNGDGAFSELNALRIPVRTADEVRRDGATASARKALEYFDDVGGLEGFWVHCDVDALDAAVMPAVDTPTPMGSSSITCPSSSVDCSRTDEHAVSRSRFSIPISTKTASTPGSSRAVSATRSPGNRKETE
jgi:hypothetical protein